MDAYIDEIYIAHDNLPRQQPVQSFGDSIQSWALAAGLSQQEAVGIARWMTDETIMLMFQEWAPAQCKAGNFKPDDWRDTLGFVTQRGFNERSAPPLAHNKAKVFLDYYWAIILTPTQNPVPWSWDTLLSDSKRRARAVLVWGMMLYLAPWTSSNSLVREHGDPTSNEALHNREWPAYDPTASYQLYLASLAKAQADGGFLRRPTLAEAIRNEFRLS